MSMAKGGLTPQNLSLKIEHSEKPVLIDFFASWCEPCKILGPILEKVADDYREKIIFFKVNIDEAPALTQKYGIEQIPTVILFKQGKPISGFVGLKDETEIKQWLNKALDMRNPSTPKPT